MVSLLEQLLILNLSIEAEIEDNLNANPGLMTNFIPG